MCIESQHKSYSTGTKRIEQHENLWLVEVLILWVEDEKDIGYRMRRYRLKDEDGIGYRIGKYRL